MFNGNRPRASSRTPANGKIGRIEGSSRPPVRSLIALPSGEHQGGEAPSGTQSQRIGRPHCLEKFEELLARRLLVPLAVALEEGQEFVDRHLALAAAEETGGEFEPRLVVVGVGRQTGAELSFPGHRLLRLLGELKRRTR